MQSGEFGYTATVSDQGDEQSEASPAGRTHSPSEMPSVHNDFAAEALTDQIGPEELRLLAHALGQGGPVDLGRYRDTTVRRQVVRRMQATGERDIASYIARVRGSSEEARRLGESVFVAVTAFFRDAEVFGHLKTWLAARAASLSAGDALRVWVPGCASGEEAYSIAILLEDTLGSRIHELDVHVFATDADERATRFARAGVYPREAVQGLTDADIQRYFVQEREHVRVAKHVRDLCVFATHDLLRQPPFRNMDVVSCRNVLIYFQRDFRQEVLNKLHYALKPEGCLVLGQAESVGLASTLFECIDPQFKLYTRRAGPSPRLLEVMGRDASVHTSLAPAAAEDMEPASIEDAVSAALVRAYVPASVVVNERGEILHLSGDTERFLQLPRGKGDFSVTALCDPALRGEIKTLLHLLCTRDDAQLMSQPVRVGRLDTTVAVRVVGRKLHAPNAHVQLGYLLSFEERPFTDTQALDGAPARDDFDARGLHTEVFELRQELAATREHLHSLVEQLEGANDRMLSTNQELQASSEEVQSSNEELQASNEELLSLNEELQLKSQELIRANETLSSIQGSIQVALVVVDAEAHVISFNALAVRIFGLLPRDHGRSINAVPCSLTLPDLNSLIGDVVRSGEPSVHRIDDAGRHYLLQVSPYENSQRVRTGAVLAFTDVAELRRAEQESQRLSEHYRATFEQATTGIAHVSLDGRWLRANRHWCETLGYSEAELLSLSVDETTHVSDRALTRLQFAAQPTRQHNELEKRYVHRDGRVIWARVAYTTISGSGKEPPYRVCVLQDITASKESERKLRASENEFRQIAASLPLMPWGADAEGGLNYFGEQWTEYLGVSMATLFEKGFGSFVHPDERALVRTRWLETVAAQRHGEVQFRLRRHDGVYRWFNGRVRPVRDEQGQIVRWFGATSDIHDDYTTRENLEGTLDALRFALAGAHAASFTTDRPLDGKLSVEASRHANTEVWTLLDSPLDASHPSTARFQAAAHPADYARIIAESTTALVRGEAYESIFRTHPSRGPERWILSRGRPVFDVDGVCRRFHGMMIDITASKRLEIQHRETLRSLQRANEIAGVGHFRYDVAKGAIAADQVLVDVLDLPGLDFSIETARAALDPEFRDQTRARFAAAAAAGDSTFDDILCFRVRDERRWLRLQLEVIYDATRQPREILGACHDITELYQARLTAQTQRDELERLVEERTRDLRQKERHLQAVLNGVPCAIGYWDANQRSIFANDAHSDWFGISPANMSGKRIDEIWRGSFGEGLAERIAEVRAGANQLYELSVTSAATDAAETRFARVYLLPDGAPGAVVGFFTLVFDITSLKRAEQLAEAARRAKGQFLANMSHEIRTPLTAVLGLAELGKKNAIARDTEECFGNIQRAGKHLLAVISDILDFSRIEAGKLEIELAAVDLGELLAQVQTTIVGAARDKGLTLRFTELTGLPRTVRTDSGRLAQVMINLLSNAVKFTERGHVHTTLGYDAGSLTISVVDTGIGMSDDTLSRLFEPFEQGVPRGGDRLGGTGLGLAICKRIITLMHGTLEMVSVKGEGTTVRVAVPCEALTAADFTPLARTALVGFERARISALADALHARGCQVERFGSEQGDADRALRDGIRCIVTSPKSLGQFSEPLVAAWLEAGGRIVVIHSAENIERTARSSVLTHATVYAQDPATPLTLLLALDTLPSYDRRAPAPDAEKPLQGVRVLAAEDHEMNRLLLREMLTNVGASLICVENGALAVEQLSLDGADAYDIVLCDIEMPVLDGYAATVQLRALAPDLPIVGLTAHAFDMARERGRSAGMTDYLTKPYSLAALTEIITRQLRPR